MTVLLELLAAAAEDLGDLKRPFALGRGRPGPPSSDCYVPNRGTSSVSTDEGSPYRQVQRRARKVDVSSSRVHELLGQAAGCETALKRAVTLPAELFTDPEWFDAERRVIHRNWVAVCRTADVTAEAQYVAVDVAGEPVVVIRGRDGVLRAMSNVCRHRSMTIVEGSGSISSLCCPYHQWTYRHDGTLINAPSMEQAEDFDVNDVCLPAVHRG